MFLRFGEGPDPLRHTLQPRAVTRRQAREWAIERGPLDEQRAAGCAVAELLGVLAQRRFASGPHRFHNRRGDCKRLRRYRGSTTRYELGDRAAWQQARTHDLLAIGRRLPARGRRARSPRTAANRPPPPAHPPPPP